MLDASIRPADSLPAGHPCAGCDVRLSAVCGVLDSCELAKFKKMGATVSLAPGQSLFHEADAATRVFTLTRGCLKLYKLLADGRRQVTGFIFPGDFLGISVNDEHAFTAESLEQSELCLFPRSRFDSFLSANGKLERELYRVAAHELAAAQEQIVLLGRKTAVERLASFFLLLAEKAERRTKAPVRFVDLPMSRSDIADYLGLTKETVSRVLSSLRSRRIVRLDALDRIEIVDRDHLAQVADGGLEN